MFKNYILYRSAAELGIAFCCQVCKYSSVRCWGELELCAAELNLQLSTFSVADFLK